MDQQTILVIGATGTVGGPVARQLLAAGYQVRLLVRDVERARTQLGTGFDYIAGRVEESEAVQRALAGCSGVHLSLQAGSNPEDIERVEYQGAMRVVELAERSPGMHLSYVSGMFVGGQIGHGVLADQAKGRVEHAIQESGIQFTIFRPTYFMDNLPKHIKGKRAMALGKQPHPLHLVAAIDFGRMVLRAFQEPLAQNRIFSIQEPEALTMVEALRLYCSLLEPDKRVMTIPVLATWHIRSKIRPFKRENSPNPPCKNRRVGVQSDLVNSIPLARMTLFSCDGEVFGKVVHVPPQSRGEYLGL
jgi:NADH dehydrogenase